MYNVIVLSNFSRGYNKYSRLYDKKNIPESTFSDKFFVLPKIDLSIGINKASKLL